MNAKTSSATQVIHTKHHIIWQVKVKIKTKYESLTLHYNFGLILFRMYHHIFGFDLKWLYRWFCLEYWYWYRYRAIVCIIHSFFFFFLFLCLKISLWSYCTIDNGLYCADYQITLYMMVTKLKSVFLFPLLVVYLFIFCIPFCCFLFICNFFFVFLNNRTFFFSFFSFRGIKTVEKNEMIV